MPNPSNIIRTQRKPSSDYLALIRERLTYDPETGVIRWSAIAPTRRVPPGSIAGSIRKADNYRVIRIGLRTFMGGHVAWFLHHGEWPTRPIRYVNANPSDLRIENLMTSNEHGQPEITPAQMEVLNRRFAGAPDAQPCTPEVAATHDARWACFRIEADGSATQFDREVLAHYFDRVHDTAMPESTNDAVALFKALEE